MADEVDDEPEASADAPKSTRAPKKRKKKGKGAENSGETPAVVPGAGTPDGERLREALRAFEVGDYRQVRTLTGELERASDPAVREAASALLGRISIDPVQVMVMLACALVLAAIIYTWIL